MDSSYEISNIGRLRHTLPNGVVRYLKTRHSIGSNTGYLNIKIGGTNTSVHKLVVEAFIRPLRNNELPHHKDGNKRNNRLDNLEILTHPQNIVEARKSGRLKTTITDDDAYTIRLMLSIGIPNKDLKMIFGVDGSTITRIKQYKRWV